MFFLFLIVYGTFCMLYDSQHQDQILSQVKDSGHRTIKVKNLTVCAKCGRKTAWRDTSGKAREKAIKFWTTTQCRPSTTQVSLARFGTYKPDRRTLGRDWVEDCVEGPLVNSGNSDGNSGVSVEPVPPVQD